MKTFTFKGVRQDGTVVEGRYEANVLQEVYRRMEFHGMYPIKAAEVDATAAHSLPNGSHHESPHDHAVIQVSA